jgi:hypothetical protein
MVLWAVTALMDGQRLLAGYSLGASFQGDAPITNHIEFGLAHKIAVILLSGGIALGAILALWKKRQGILLAGASAVALLAVGVWSVDEYGTLGAPVSLEQFVALLAIAFVSYRKWTTRKSANHAT